MTPRQRRGKRLFVVLATLIILEKLAGVCLVLLGGLAEIHWFRSVAVPMTFAAAVAFLWEGDIWLRWLVGVGCVLAGGPLVFVSTRVLVEMAEVTPPKATGFYYMQTAGYPIGLIGLVGLFYVVAGLMLMFSPSMRDFFRYQREGPRAWIESMQ